MIACLLMLGSSLLGVASTMGLRTPLGSFVRLGVGLAVGQALLLWVPLAIASALDASPTAAGTLACAAISAACVGACARARLREALVRFGHELASALRAETARVAFATGTAFLALFAWLLHTHYLLPRADGLHSAGVTWGDLPIHLALAARFRAGPGFAAALEHPLFLHGPLSYPFVPDHSVAVLEALGLSLRQAFIAGSWLALATLVLVIHGCAQAWSGHDDARVSTLTLVTYLLAGGFGASYLIGPLASGVPLHELLATTNATYFMDDTVLKANHIGNLFIAARTAAYGMPIAGAALVLLAQQVDAERLDRHALALSGSLVGSLPLVHSHSFLVASGCAFCYAVLDRRLLRQSPWWLLPYLAVAVPQLAWLFGQHPSSALRFELGFLREAAGPTQWLRDLVLGMGLPLLLLPLALWVAPPRARKLAAPLLLLLPLANVVTFTPAFYDNIKLVAWFDLAAAALIAGLCVRVWDRQPARSRLARALVVAGLVCGCTLSGVAAVGFELCNDVLVVTHGEREFARLVEQRTPPDAVVATAASDHDPVAMFSGRRVLVAAPQLLATHGIDVSGRARDLVGIYAGAPWAAEAIERLHVGAVVVGPRERQSLPMLNEAFLGRVARSHLRMRDTTLYLLR
jgi:hypothetical protein